MATPAAILSILVQADGVSRTARQIRGMDDDLRKADKTGGKTASTFKKVGAVVGGIVAFDTLRRGVGAAVGEFEEARKVGAQTQAVIKSTGGAANVSAKHVANLASSISKKVGVDDEAIQSGANLLLTFKNVRNELGRGNKVFDRATKAAVDLSAAGFGDLSATSKQLGKALNDPIKGLTALGRSGVTFTQQQQEKIKSLVEEGKTLKAQKMILREVESQVKGSAAAQATALDKAKVAFGNLAEAAGAILVPAIDKAAAFMATLINQMIEGKSTGGAIISVFKGFGTVIGTTVTAIAGLIGWFRQHETVMLAVAAAAGVLVTAFTAMKILAVVQAAVVALRGAMLALNAAFLTNPVVLVVAAVAALAAGFVVAYRESETFRKIVDAVWGALKTAMGAIVEFVSNLDGLPEKAKAAGNAILNGIVDGIKALPGVLLGAAKWLFETWKGGVEAWLNSYVTVGKWLLNRIIDGVKALGGVVAGAAKWLFDTAKKSIEAYVDAYKTVGRWMLNRIVDGFKVVTELLATVGTWLKNRVVELVQGAKDGLVSLGSWVVNRVVDGFKTLTEPLSNVGSWLLKTVSGLMKAAKDGFVGVGSTVVGWIVDGLKGGIKAVAKFAKLILNVIGKIPGVNTDGPVKAIDKFTEGLAKGGVFQAFARGGAFGRTKGVVNAPITLMGEEAPRHPEFVIPTNPAYRKRAKGILAQAASAIGFAKGGKYDRDYGAHNPATIPFEAAAKLAEAAGLPGITYAQIAIGESGLRPGAVSHDGGYGLWQMTPRVQSQETRLAWQRIGSFFNPWHNALMAKVLAGSGTGVSNYYGTSHVTDWNKHYTGSTEGYVPHGLATGAPSLNPLDLIKKLPGVGDLPGWLGGFGKWTLGQVGKFIKDQIGKVAGGILGGAVPGWGVIDRMAKSFGMTITDTYRPGGTTYHGQMLGVSGRARATDYSNGTAPTAEMMGFAKRLKAEYGSQLRELFYSPLGGSVKDGRWVPGMIIGGGLGTPGNHYNHVHVAFRRGGVYGGVPFVGSYAQGGVVPRTGMAMVHRGETIAPAGAGTVLYATLDLGRGIRERVRLEFDAQGRQMNAVYQAGLA